METQIHEKRDANYAFRTSSLERLPVEILSEIVEIYLSYYYPKITTIMHICRRLRHVTLELPTIWCNLRILSPFNHWGLSYGYEFVRGISPSIIHLCFSLSNRDTFNVRQESNCSSFSIKLDLDL
jgi:hypothetical protein